MAIFAPKSSFFAFSGDWAPQGRRGPQKIWKREIEESCRPVYSTSMKSIRYVHWQDGEMWLGYLEDYPDYMTQGETLKELQENLKDLFEDLTSGDIPNVRKVAELQLA